MKFINIQTGIKCESNNEFVIEQMKKNPIFKAVEEKIEAPKEVKEEPKKKKK